MASKHYTETIFTVLIFGSERSEPLIVENNSIISFEFIEDIDHALPMAIFEFIDRGGAVEILPIIGRELVTIIYGPDIGGKNFDDPGTRTRTYMAYDVDFKSEIQTAAGGATTVTMKLVDPLYITMNFSRYSKAWVNKTGSEIISDICTNMISDGKALNFYKFENSGDKIGSEINENKDVSFIMPYWTPTETIRWLLKRMKSSDGNPGYLFYYSTKGFNLVTLPYLFDSSKNIPDSEKYFFDRPSDRSIATGRDVYFHPNRILQFKMYPPSNMALSHLPGGTYMKPVFDNKEMDENSGLGSLETEKYNFHGSEPLYLDINNATSHINITSGNMETKFRNEWIKRYMMQLQVKMLVKGDVKRFAGMLIDLEWYAMKTGMQNEYYNGRYLIKTIEHIFVPSAQPAYKQMLTIVKTSYKDTVAGGALGT